jgi:cytochrome o ubiquinol oxidase subunit II
MGLAVLVTKLINACGHLITRGLYAILSTLLLAGCSDILLLNPKGPIGISERDAIGVAFALMLIVVIPVIVMAVWFPRRYKESAQIEDYDPKWSHSGKIDLVIWLIPAIIVAGLGTLAWKETHRLDPFQPIASAVSPINIEAVSLDWKWLFIYPDQHIATVNQLVIPVAVPVSFRITSGSVMTSFFIPQLGSQIYAMAGMQTRLHLLANATGNYIGQNQQFSGSGYSDMNFNVRVTSSNQFEEWVQQVRQSPHKLDQASFAEISAPSANFPVTAYSAVEPGLFEDIVDSFRHAMADRQGDIPAQHATLEQH